MDPLSRCAKKQFDKGRVGDVLRNEKPQRKPLKPHGSKMLCITREEDSGDQQHRELMPCNKSTSRSFAEICLEVLDRLAEQAEAFGSPTTNPLCRCQGISPHQ